MSYLRWQHRIQTRRRKTIQKQSRETGNIGYKQDEEKQYKNNPEKRFSGLFLYCFSSSCLYPILPVSLDCFCIVFLRLVCTLYCQFLCVFRRLVCTLYCQFLWIVFVLFNIGDKQDEEKHRETGNIGYKQDEEKQYKNNPEKLAI
jgi:hypothetical protein